VNFTATGKKKAVLMDIKEYQQAMRHLEDLEDALRSQ
jgi:hypothetical protein